MRWAEKMQEAMKMMKEACTENDVWGECSKCPFDSYCTVPDRNGGVIPSDFVLDEVQE